MAQKRGPPLFTHGLSSLSQSATASSPAANSPAEQRDDAKVNFLKTMRALPTQHYWNVYFDKHEDTPPTQKQAPASNGATAHSSSSPSSSSTTAAATGSGAQEYTANLEQLGSQIESVQDFWRYSNNTPIEQMKMRESIYLFKEGFRPVWEDRRNVHGGSWTFRIPKNQGRTVWEQVQMLAIGETFEAALEEGDQLCGVGLSIRFTSHLITVWHRDSSKKKSIDGILRCLLENLPDDVRPRPDNYFYKKHSDHAGFKAPPELQAVLDSQKKRDEAAAANAAAAKKAEGTAGAADAAPAPEVSVNPPSA